MLLYYTHRSTKTPLTPNRTTTLPQLLQHDLHMIGLRLDDKASFHALEQFAKDRKKWLQLVQRIRLCYLKKLSDQQIYVPINSILAVSTDQDYFLNAQMHAAQDDAQDPDLETSFTSMLSLNDNVQTTEPNVTSTSKKRYSNASNNDEDRELQSPLRKRNKRKNGRNRQHYRFKGDHQNYLSSLYQIQNNDVNHQTLTERETTINTDNINQPVKIRRVEELITKYPVLIDILI